MMASTVLASQEEHLYKAFQVLDKDGSGYIDRDELVAALDKYGDLSDLDSILKQASSSRRAGGSGWTVLCSAHLHDPADRNA